MDETHRRYASGRYGEQEENKQKVEQPQGPTRTVDIFAGKDSLADKLRRRRVAIEGGDASGGKVEEYQ